MSAGFAGAVHFDKFAEPCKIRPNRLGSRRRGRVEAMEKSLQGYVDAQQPSVGREERPAAIAGMQGCGVPNHLPRQIPSPFGGDPGDVTPDCHHGSLIDFCIVKHRVETNSDDRIAGLKITGPCKYGSMSRRRVEKGQIQAPERCVPLPHDSRRAGAGSAICGRHQQIGGTLGQAMRSRQKIAATIDGCGRTEPNFVFALDLVLIGLVSPILDRDVGAGDHERRSSHDEISNRCAINFQTFVRRKRVRPLAQRRLMRGAAEKQQPNGGANAGSGQE